MTGKHTDILMITVSIQLACQKKTKNKKTSQNEMALSFLKATHHRIHGANTQILGNQKWIYSTCRVSGLSGFSRRISP